MSKDHESDKIEELTQRIKQLEETLSEIIQPYRELVDRLSHFQNLVVQYFQLLNIYRKFGMISIDVILPEIKDEISKEILRILAEKQGLNVSQITAELRMRRGTASRRIVSGRLQTLVSRGYVTEKSQRRQKRYEISDEVIKKWSHVLGLSK
ncbi:MAG: winged helix-turn-helix transcriptional regulator [Methanomassiliicoccales archaeon]|nr:winged helix-turn-helix transcriptional regulator [Methanomassiliicoccales archaeon]